MPGLVNNLWTDERIETTINRQYILDQLEPEEQVLLDRSLSFGEGLTNGTYLDWILTRARRFFLILVDVGVPDQIFGVVDESYDDSDLPIAAEDVAALRLSYHPDKTLDKKFYEAQFRFTVKDIRPGEHVIFGADELIPVEPIGSKTGGTISNKDDADQVILPSSVTKVYTRLKVVLDREPTFIQEADVLTEVASLIKYRHAHVTSFHASYAEGHNVHVLLTPASKYSLKSFLHDPPKNWTSLPKTQRREILVNWPHCLANALAWLHAQGRAHGAIRPSNVHLDSDFKIFFGQFDAGKLLHPNIKTDDIEAYQYAAPERWKRAATAQATGAAKTLGNSGGRTARKPPAAARPQSASATSPFQAGVPTAVNTMQPTNTAVPFIPSSKSRIRLSNYRTTQANGLESRSSGHEASSAPSSTIARFSSSTTGTSSSEPKQQSSSSTSSVPSVHSSSPSSSSHHTAQKQQIPVPDPIAVPAPEVRTAIVQTWQSAEHDPFPSDIFTFGAISLDILSFLCKRSPSAFTKHRGAKNRTAGRGGGLADASFHANIGQLYSWCKILDQDARKKINGKEGGETVYGVVKPMLEVIIHCIDKNPHTRLTADIVESRFADCILRHTNGGSLHCSKHDNESMHERDYADLSPTVEHDQSRKLFTGAPVPDWQKVEEDSNGPLSLRARQKRERLREKLGLGSEPGISPPTSTGKPVNASSPYGRLPMLNATSKHGRDSIEPDDSASMITIETIKPQPSTLRIYQDEDVLVPVQDYAQALPQRLEPCMDEPHPGTRISLGSYGSSFDVLSSTLTASSSASDLSDSNTTHLPSRWVHGDRSGKVAKKSNPYKTNKRESEAKEPDYDTETSETAATMIDFLSPASTRRSSALPWASQ